MAERKSGDERQADERARLAAQDAEPQTKKDARTLDAEVALPENERKRQGTGQGETLVDPAEQQHVSSMDPHLANLLPPEALTGDMKEDAKRALERQG